MKEVILCILVAFSGYVQPDDYQHRFDKKTYDRITRLFPYVRQAEWNTDVPPEYILGTVHNESQGVSDAIGDGGLSHGLGQIRCPWLNTLDKMGLSVLHSCRGQLAQAEWNVYAIAEILSYVRRRYELSWKEAVKVYHLGPLGLTDIDDSAYVNRTKYFADYWKPYYRTWKFVRSWL